MVRVKFSSVTIYKDVARIHEIFTDLKTFSDIDETLSGGKMAIFKKITVCGLLTRWEMGYEKTGKRPVQIVAIDDGLEEVEFTLSDELEREVNPVVGDYVKVTLVGNWKKGVTKNGTEDELVADEVKKAVDLEVIGKYEFEDNKAKKKQVKKAKSKKVTKIKEEIKREELDDEIEPLFEEVGEVEVKLGESKDTKVK